MSETETLEKRSRDRDHIPVKYNAVIRGLAPRLSPIVKSCQGRYENVGASFPVVASHYNFGTVRKAKANVISVENCGVGYIIKTVDDWN
jgi:hypothetical protein